MKRIGYLRVSTDEQSPDRQVDGLATICDELHIEHMSAVSRSRPVYERVIAALCPGDVLVVWDLDRAWRSTVDALNEISALQGRGVGFRIANFPFDTTTPEGYLLLTVLSGMGEFERRILSRRTKEGLAAARKRGVRLGRPCKLTDMQVAEARQRIANRDGTIVSIAEEMEVARWTLSRALRRAQ